jgi:hypothetical protein
VIDPGVMERQLAALGAPALDGFPWQTDDFAAVEPDFARLQAEFEEPRLGSTRMTEALIGRAFRRRYGVAPSARRDSAPAAL